MILLERVVNLFNENDKIFYAQEVWDILQRSYQYAGGFKSASSKEELIAKSGLWKLVIRNGMVTAVTIYKDLYGRKTIGSGTDGSAQGKKDYKMLREDDIKFNRSWAEVSGKVESLMQKMNANPIPNEYAEFLTKHNILSYNKDGYHYTRLIAGSPVEKIMYGSVNLTSDDKEQLKNKGVNFTPLE